MKGVMQDKDLIYYKEGGEVKSLGYRIDAPRLQGGHHALPHILKGLRGGGGGLAGSLAIPAGLWRKDDETEPPACSSGGAARPVREGLYATLLALAGRRRARASSRRKSRRKKRRRTRRKH